MKKLLAIIGALCAFSSLFAQSLDFTEESTPELGSAYSWSWNSDGSTVLITELGFHEATYYLPLRAKVRLGYAAVIGNRIDPLTNLEGPVFGAQAYLKVPIRQLDGLFIKGDFHALLGQETPALIGFGIGLGFEF